MLTGAVTLAGFGLVPRRRGLERAYPGQLVQGFLASSDRATGGDLISRGRDGLNAQLGSRPTGTRWSPSTRIGAKAGADRFACDTSARSTLSSLDGGAGEPERDQLRGGRPWPRRRYRYRPGSHPGYVEFKIWC